MNKNIEIVAYEREPLSLFNWKYGENIQDFHVIEMRLIQTRKSYMVLSQTHSLGYSRLHIFRKSWTTHQIRLRIYELLRPLLANIPEVNKFNEKGK